MNMDLNFLGLTCSHRMRQGFKGLKTSQRSLDSPGWSKFHLSPPEANQKKNYGLYQRYMLPKAIFSVHYVPGTTADRNVTIQYLMDTEHQFNNLKKNKIKLGELMLMWDYASPHSAYDTQAFLAHINPASKAACLQSRKIKHQMKGCDFGGRIDCGRTISTPTVDATGTVDGGRLEGRYRRRWPVGKTVGRTVGRAVKDSGRWQFLNG